MARTADFQRITTDEISVELADGVSLEQVKEVLDGLDDLPRLDDIKDTDGKVLATIIGRDDDFGRWECTDEGDD